MIFRKRKDRDGKRVLKRFAWWPVKLRHYDNGAYDYECWVWLGCFYRLQTQDYMYHWHNHKDITLTSKVPTNWDTNWLQLIPNQFQEDTETI